MALDAASAYVPVNIYEIKPFSGIFNVTQITAKINRINKNKRMFMAFS